MSVRVTARLPNAGPVHSLETEATDSVHLVKQYLLSLGVLTQPYTAFSLSHKGEIVHNETLLSSLADDAATVDLEMVPENLTLADVQDQLDQVREAFGLVRSDTTYVNAGATRLHEIKHGSKKQKKLTEDDILELAELPDDSIKAAITKTDESTFEIVGVTPSSPNDALPKPAALDLSFSKWQPLCRTPSLKLRGILAFIYFRANNDKEWHFVATSRGFSHVPQLTETTFAEPSNNTAYIPTLMQLIEQTSPSSLSHARKNAERIKQDPLGCLAIPQINSVAPWLVKPDQRSVPNVNSFATPTEVREWNEDYQSARELDAESFTEKITRDRSLCNAASGFADASLQGAMKIVEGAVKALNPDVDQETSQLYLDKGIFYTHGADFATAYAGVNTAEGARKAVKKGIQGVEQLMLYDNAELCPVLTSVVDYCGRSIVAQAPVPGIFREVPMIVYGFSEDHAQVHNDEHVDELLKEFAENLHLKRHPVNKEGTELNVSAEIHAAKSTDGRLYLIDLHRLYVPDLLSKDAELNLLRLEAVKSFYTENPEAPPLNPDVWMSPEDLPSDYAAKEYQGDIKLATEVAQYVREAIIPRFVNSIASSDFSSGDAVDPIDGVHLTSLLHRNGVNMRLLGLLYAKASEANLSNLSSVALEEAVARSAKYVLKERMAAVNGVENAARVVEDFVSKLLAAGDAELLSSLEKRMQGHFGFESLPGQWKDQLCRPSLLRLIALKTGLQFSSDLKLMAVNPIIKYSFPRSYTTSEALEAARISVANAHSKYMENVQEKESQEESKDESKNENTDETENGSKDSSEELDEESKSAPRESSEEVESNEELTQALNESLTILVQALSLYAQVYGSSHSEVAHAFNKVATCFFEYSNDVSKAIELCRKAITLAERVSGIDNYDVIIMYTNLAFFYQIAGQIGTAISISQRVISMYDEITWRAYKDRSAMFGTIGNMLLQTRKDALVRAAIPWLEHAVSIGKDSPAGPSGNAYFQLAQGQILTQDYKNASRSMESAYKYYKAAEGPDSSRTKEMKSYLTQLLQVTITNEQTGSRITAAIQQQQQQQLSKSKKRSNKKKSKAKAKSKAAN